MDSPYDRSGLSSSASSREMHVSGRNKGIREIDLNFALVDPTMDGDDHSISEDNAVLLGAINSLDLSRNEIEVLSNLDALSSLRRLDVSYNLIVSVHGLPFTITRLNLSHNRLRDLDGVALLPHLKELDVSSNRLANLAGLTPQVPLQVLRADDNRIVSTMGLDDMPSLRVLSLANNFIERLDELVFLSNAVSLQALTLRNNPVTQVNSYRLLVGQRQAALLSLDGVPLLRPSRSLVDGVTPPTSERQERSEGRLARGIERVSGGGRSAVDHRGPTPSIHGVVSSANASALVTPVRAVESPRAAASQLADEFFLRDFESAGRRPGTAPATEEYLPSPPAAPQSPTPHSGAPVLRVDPHSTLNASDQSQSTPVAEQRAPQPSERDRAVHRTDSQRLVNSRTPQTSGTNSADGRVSPLPPAAVRMPKHAPAHFSYAQQFQAALALSSGASARGSTLLSRSESSPHTSGRVAAAAGEAAAGAISARGSASTRSKGLTARHPYDSAGGHTDAAGKGRGGETAADESAGMQAEDGIRSRRAVAQLHDCLVAKEQLEKENSQLRARLKKCESQLAESRRVVSAQLSDLSHVRVERDALRQSEADLQERAERSKLHLSSMESHHREEVAAVQLQFERMKTFFEAQVADLRRKLAAEVARGSARGAVAPLPQPAPVSAVNGRREGYAVSTAHLGRLASSFVRGHKEEDTTTLSDVSASKSTALSVTAPSAPPVLPSPPAPPPLRVPEMSRGADRESASPLQCAPPSGTALAEQLKSWLFSQLAEDASRAEQEDLLRRLQKSLDDEPTSDGRAVDAVSAEKARELLEIYVLQHQQPTPRPATPERFTDYASPPKSASPPHPSPHGESAEHAGSEDLGVSRAKPTLSPPKRKSA